MEYREKSENFHKNWNKVLLYISIIKVDNLAEFHIEEIEGYFRITFLYYRDQTRPCVDPIREKAIKFEAP